LYSLLGFSLLLLLRLQKSRVEKFTPLLAGLALVYALYRILPFPVQSGPAFHYLTAEYSYPVETLNFVEANGISGNVFALWNWGGYIHWRTDGKLKVYVDGRADTVYDDETYLRYVAVLGSSSGWLELLEGSGADYVLWPHTRGQGQQKLRELVATGRWRPVYSDAVSWLLARTATVPQSEWLSSSPGPWRDLAVAANSNRAGDTANALREARAVREIMPWHKGACDLLVGSYRRLGNARKAEEVLTDCRSYFPSAYLR